MRVMGLDVDSSTVDVAANDSFGWTVQGAEVIQINETEEEFGLGRLKELVAQYEVDRSAAGLPRNMNNSIGPRTEASMSHREKIKGLSSLPVDCQDEQLTTAQAERMLVEQANTSRAGRKKIIDESAAVMISQNYLDGSGK